MTGEADLDALIASMEPVLNDGTYVFCTVAEAPEGVAAVATMREPEGLTLVLSQADADAHGLSYDYQAAWITLQVQSALEAVGLTAAFAAALGDAGVSCNVIAGYFHDHIFVPAERADDAMAALRALALQDQ